MQVKFLGTKGTWQDVKNSARTTVGLEHKDAEPTSSWKRRILLAEHSPIRKLHINWIWKELKSWISVHFVRHKIGIEHFVSTQREDRNNEISNRDEEPQGALINHECEATAQTIINISRKRLCNNAHFETRIAWLKFLYELQKYEPELYSVCVPDCIYRGWCYEMNSCGYHKTNMYQRQLLQYREGVNYENNSDD